MKMREEFEAWHKRVVAGCIATGLVSYARQVDEFKEAYFVAWEASRAAIEIELPDEQPGYQYYAPDVLEAIEAAGLKVKP